MMLGRYALTMLVLSALAFSGCKKEGDAPGTKPGAEAKKDDPAGKPAAKPAAKPADKAGAAPVQVKIDPSAKNAAKALGGLLGGLAKAGAAMAGGKKLGPVVNWRKLKPFLPEQVGALKATGDVRGQTGGIGGLVGSTVRRRYKDDKRTMRIKIADTAAVPMLRAAFNMARSLKVDSSTEIKKGMDIAGSPALVEFKNSTKRAKVSVLVAGRYLVNLSLRPATKVEDAVAMVETLKLKELAAVKAPAAKAAPAK